ncbi:MAG: hypothetical protein HGA76_07035 [Candidatus Firestonebacteria bacterium]|nr:hypothetical protein [Candidatus Firestonebacteria bacterium]
MRRHMGLSWVLVLLATGFWGAQVQASVTEKVDAMIAENSPLKVRTSDLWVQVGGPLIMGVQFDEYANPNVALGVGVGSFVNGASVDLAAKFYLLPGKFSPFVSVGGVYYYTSPRQNVFALTGTAGLAYFFNDGLGLSLGWCYLRSVTQSDTPFTYEYINDRINAGMPQLGLHWNF